MFNLTRSKSLVLFLFSFFLVAKGLAQVPVGLNSSENEIVQDNITVCEGAVVVFTAFPKDSSSDHHSYEFWKIRHSDGTQEMLRSRSDIETWSDQAGISFVNNDQIFVRVFNIRTAGGSPSDPFTDSRKITVNIIAKPQVTLTHNAVNVNGTFCVGQEIVFTAIPSTASYTYEFYLGTNIDNIVLEQSAGSSNTFTRELSVESTVLVKVFNSNGCVGEANVSVRPVIIDDAGEIFIEGHGNDTYYSVCYDSPPPKLESRIPATVDGFPKSSDSKSYQWMSSFDGIVWNPIPNAKEESFQPPRIIRKTYFRRDITHGLNGGVPCSKPSEPIVINPAAELKVGTIDNAEETICKGGDGQEITVTENGINPSFRYQWQESADNVAFTDIATNAAGQSYTPQTVTQTTYYRRVTSVASVPSASCSVTTAVHKLNVIEFNPGELTSSTVTICHGDTPSTIVESAAAIAAAGAILYQWQESIDDGINWSDVNAAKQKSYAPSSLTQTTWFRRIVKVEMNGTTCDIPSRNHVKIIVTPDLSEGALSSDQKICLDETPETLKLRDLNQALNNSSYSIRWESSLASDSGYATIVNEITDSLAFTVNSAPKVTTYYRAVIVSPISSCDGIIGPILIEVQQPHELIQTGSAPPNTQDICTGNPIVPIVFEWGGSADAIEIAPNVLTLNGIGLIVTTDALNKSVTITGTPTVDVDIVATTMGTIADVCSPTTLNYKIDLINDPMVPDRIKIESTAIWQNGSQIGSWEICPNPSSTTFSGHYYSPEDARANNLEWQLVDPANAGHVDVDGTMQWSSGFHGTAEFRVRGKSTCDGSKFSSWSSSFRVNVIEDQVEFPLHSIGDIKTLILQGSDTGEDPNCQITNDTPDTQYSINGQLNQVYWTVEVQTAGNPNVPTPGNIGLYSGLMIWNTGFWGDIIIRADPTNCHWDNNPSSDVISSTLRKTYSVSIPEADTRVVDLYIPSSGQGSTLPSCKGETSGFVTHFMSNLEPAEQLVWTINNSDAGTINSNSGMMTWKADFSGQVTVKAEISQADETCVAPYGEMLIEIPASPKITLTSGNDSNIVSVCQNTAISTITYLLEGAASTAEVSGLPNGITGNYNATPQISSYAFTGSVENSGVVYTITVMDHSYSFTTSSSINPNPNEKVAQELKQLMLGDPTITPSVSGTQLILTAKIAGKSFTSTITTSGAVPQISISGPTVVKETRTFTISGSSVEAPLAYAFTVSSFKLGSSCNVATVTGTIHIRPKASFALSSAANTDEQTVCYGEPITNIVYDINNAASAYVLPKGLVFTDGLPDGVTGNVVNGQLIISGTPNETITTSATYLYTIKTINTDYGCDEAIASGKITVKPNLKAKRISSPFTQNQTLCEGEAMQMLIYDLNGVPDADSGNLSYDISNLPAGVGGTYDSDNGVFRFFGTPKPNPPINQPTVYSYSLTTKLCNGSTETTTITLTINPAPRLELVTIGKNHQTICDTEAMEEIRYKFRGATGFDNFEVTPSVGWINEYIVPSSSEIRIVGKPTNPHENTTTYTYSVKPKGTSYGCYVYPTVSGTVTVKPSQQLELISSPDAVDQELCNNSSIVSIVYEFRGSTERASVTGLPDGVFPTIIEVNPEKEITVSGSSAAVGEIHSIRINDQHYTNTATGGESPAQIASQLATAINNGLVALATVAGSTITITGSEIGVIIDTEVQSSPGAKVTMDLPILLKSHGKIEIKGTPTLSEDVNPRSFEYTIKTVGSNSCSSTTKTGTIIIRSKPTLKLTSAIGTDQQTVYNAACDGSTITPIEYVFGGSATKVKFSGLPPGVEAALTSSNTYTISGKLNVNNHIQKTFTYSATTDGQSCSPQVIMTGMIEVNPLPIIFTDYIIANDITPVSCEGGSDGAITIPEESPGFEERIGGAQNHIRQVDHVTITNDPDLSDIFKIVINGDPYEHTVIPIGMGGPIQTAAEVAHALIDKINLGTPEKENEVTASYNATNTIVIKANVAGTPFIINSVNVATSGSTSTMTATTTTANRTTLYGYTWTGPDQFISSDLSISNLKAGVYALTVTINNCVGTTASFTLSEPVSMTIDTALCNGTLHAEVSGGVAPYTFKLYDDKNTLLNTAVSNAAKTYEGLTPGADYILEILDDKCNIPKQKQINIPFDLAYDAAIPVVVPDYCNDGDGDGFIELGGNAAGMAFSGGSNQFIYKWIGPDNYGAMTRDIYNLEPGVYTVTVTDAVLGCETTKSFTIDSVDPIIITATQNSIASLDLYCPEDETAAIEIDVVGGLGNYSYSWTKNGVVMPGKKSKKLDALGKGIYEVTVSDAMPSGAAAVLDPCTVSKKFEVKGPSPLTMVVNSGTVTKTFCPNTEELASLDVEISGGTPPYTLIVTAEDGTPIQETTSNLNTTISDLDPSKNGSTYTIEISDSNTCTPGTTSPTTVYFESIAPIEIKTQVDQIDCKNGKLGRIKLELVSGKIENPEAVQVQWKSAATNFYTTWAAAGGILEDIMTPGTYQVIISQDSCELFKQSVEINDVNDTLQVNVSEEKSGGCNGELGQVSLDINGGLIPYTIKWQKFKLVSSFASASTTTVSTTTASSTTSSATFVSETDESLTTSLQWVDVPGQANNAIAMNLDVGTYRAIVSDSSDELNTNGLCAGTIITRNFIIGASVYELASFDINSGNSTCGDATSEIEFTLRSSLPIGAQGIAYDPIILLNNADPQENLKDLGNNTYKIIDLKAGDYTLNIKPGNPQTATSSQTLSSEEECSIIFPFNINEVSSIEFKGETSYQIDPCTSSVAIEIISESIQGGVPFNIGGLITYDYRWVFNPEEGSTQGTQQFVGNTIANATVGSYELIISDSNGCESEPVLFTVTTNEIQSPFVIEGILQDLSSTESTTTLVKVLPPTCETSTPNGQIGISVSGGSSPYTIQWFKEEIIEGIGTTSTTASFVEVVAAKNTTLLNNLSPGTYKLEIRSQINNCGSNLENNSVFHSEFIVVPKRMELLLTDGPYIDQDLCMGEPGRLFVELFNNNSSTPSFYYNGKVVAVDEDLKYSDNGYTLIIENPVALAELVITNAQGCKVTSKIEITDIGNPNFEYTTPSFAADGVVLAREEITFENTSDLPFKYSEWIFGDGTENFTEIRTGTVSPVRHTYGISGTYFVTLRNYSYLGCFEEISMPLSVGKGYNILAPNVFSPNKDGINDEYRIVFSGFRKVNFSIYDSYGNLLYNEIIEEADIANLGGLNLNGWDGNNAPSSPYFIYQFIGNLITDDTEITRTGTFALIQ